jgi:hypothetical protein
MAPEVPVKIRVELAPAVDGAAEIAIFCAVPGVSVSDDGWAVTPLDRPVMETETMPVKPLTGTALTLICCVGPPGSSVMDPGVEESEKSAGGSDEPPQEASRKQKASREQETKPEQVPNIFVKEFILNPPRLSPVIYIGA